MGNSIIPPWFREPVIHRQRDTEDGFLVARAPSLADVALVAYTRVADQGGFDLAGYPAVRGWVARVEAALKITD